METTQEKEWFFFFFLLNKTSFVPKDQKKSKDLGKPGKIRGFSASRHFS